ncbi:hypothetical protein Hypma_011236 [Hypsizygus marmoreus]|uniref:F-box domain-containing protein n=1 Tax=Hypsizygus marmoreus TaxID=39966 RepID=A0A369JMA6_HYPMA|nr:hypothetical protein Hypma_011236 [Hypsizygus marmoreus]
MPSTNPTRSATPQGAFDWPLNPISSSIRRRHTTVYALPPEILSMVFICCLPCLNSTSHHRNDAPLVFLSVSHMWRACAISTPQLWGALNITQGCEPSRRRIDEWLARAKASPLSLRLSYREDSPALHVLATVLRRNNLKRIEALSICLPFHNYSSIADHINGEIPLLSTLTLEVSEKSGVGTISHTTLDFSQAPNLREVTITVPENVTARMLASSSVRMPWAQLTHLTVEENALCPDNAASILSQCINLVVCALEIGGHLGREDEAALMDFPVTVLRALHTLNIVDNGLGSSNRLSPLLRRLTLPALKSLEIEAPGMLYGRGFGRDLLNLQARSRFALESMELLFVCFKMEQLETFLHRTPSLRALRLEARSHHCDYSRVLIGIRYIPSSAQNVLPRLQKLFVTSNSPDDGAAKQGVVDSIASRWWPNGQHPDNHVQQNLSRLEQVFVQWRDRSFVIYKNISRRLLDPNDDSPPTYIVD